MTPEKYPQLSLADEELLSAYLDRQLSAPEQLNLERRLAREPTLRAGLDELRAAVGMLRELPTITPPRSFTLDLEVMPRQRWRLFPPLRLATLATVLLLALSLTPDLAATLDQRQAPSAAQSRAAYEAAPTEAAAESMPAAKAPAPTAAPEVAMAPAAPAPQSAGAAAPVPTGAAAAAAAPAAATEAPAPAAAAPAAAEAPAAAPAAATEAPAAAAANQDSSQNTARAAATASSAGGVSVAAAPPSAVANVGGPNTPGSSPSSSPGTTTLPTQAPAASTPLSGLRWLQISLAALAIALAAAAGWALLRERA